MSRPTFRPIFRKHRLGKQRCLGIALVAGWAALASPSRAGPAGLPGKAAAPRASAPAGGSGAASPSVPAATASATTATASAATATATAPAATAPAAAPAASAPVAAAATLPAPAVAQPEPAPVQPAPAVQPAAPPLAVTAPVVVASPGEAVVHVAVNHRDAWLEMRSYVDSGDFVRVCRAPCDAKLQVEGREARVTAPGMTTSNIFRFDAGSGTAGVRIDGGSASARRAGIITLAIGIPVALIGMAAFAQGRLKDSSGLQAAGIAGLAAGGLSITVSLPLLLIGTTHVKNAKGSLIALSEPRGGAL